MAALLLGAFSTAVAAVIVNIALPGISEQLAIRQASAHWLVTGFTAPGTLTMLLAPWFARTAGVRKTFLAANLLFLLASLLCGFGGSFPVLVAGRILQGMASGLILTLTLVAIADAYPVVQRGRAMANFGLGIVLAPMLGPPLGGLLMEAFGWRSVMFAPLPFCAVSLLLAFRMLPAHVALPERQRFDWPGFALLSALLVSLLGGVTWLQLAGWPAEPSLALGVLVAALAAALLRWEWRCTAPIVDLRLFRFRAFSASACVGFTYGLAVWGSGYMLPLFLQAVCGFTPLEIGLVMLPAGVILLLMIPLAGRMADTRSPQRTVAVGLVCFAGSFLLLSVAGDSSGAAGFAVIALLITMGRGFGLGIMIPALDATASRAVPPGIVPEALAMMNFLRQLGGALSPTLMALLLESRILVHSGGEPVSTAALVTPAVHAGFHDTLVALGALFLLAVLPAWRMRVRASGYQPGDR